MRFDEHFLRGALSEVTIAQSSFPDDARFSVDTRTLQEGDIFVALSGAQTDGHQFLEQALSKGAAGLFITDAYLKQVQTLDAIKLRGKLLISVPDTLHALTRMASVWRTQFDYPVVAITGSVGKTSTKEMLANILNGNGTTCLASYGNQNTRIGLSLNMLRMRSHHKAAIFEVGINKRGEMAELARMLNPTTAIITNIGHCHMEGLGSLADIALEKRDIFKYFTEESIGIINGDQAVLANVGYVHPVIKFGSKTVNQIQARKVSVQNNTLQCTLKIYKAKYTIILNHAHEGALYNTLAAAAAAQLLGVSNDAIVQGIQTPPVVTGRFESRLLKGNKGILINDCYNANPESMKAALLAFQRMETKAQKIAILGDMLELGVTSPFWHRQIGRFLRKVPSLRRVILVGDMVQWTRKMIPVGVDVELVPTWKEAVKLLEDALDAESVVLVKGSQGIQLNNLVHAVTETPVAR